ncbi:VOC family protein [Demequina lignilytica]|uniref:VOC family protein n=1 Tax=Demequina lignilytica TaxID=3051663 RepID=A0AB35MH05_9MICO|nr:VOC family protein [Demequina sp. SYSU T0a273]MDN4483056.1 VOC family protein [Demequina sp. SYSU T0a273]
MTASPHPSDRIAAGTRMGPVELHVRDLDAMLAYYRDVLALDHLSSHGDTHVLGRHGVATVTLTRSPGLPVFDRSGAGLFHTAVLFDTAPGLAAGVARVAQSGLGRYTGSADHLVSEAFYFDDPEGNGVELYLDRPREAWKRDAAGRPLMDTLYLDPNAFLTTHLGEDELAAPTAVAKVGHVHLQVGDIPSAKDFYVGVLGFDEVLDMGSALFVSAGGYHHHIGLNTWNSRGAGPRAASLGLGTMDVVLPAEDDLGALRDRVAHRGGAVDDDGRTVRIRDPWGSELRFTVDGRG